jgi:hypothetical protein
MVVARLHFVFPKRAIQIGMKPFRASANTGRTAKAHFY